MPNPSKLFTQLNDMLSRNSSHSDYDDYDDDELEEYAEEQEEEHTDRRRKYNPPTRTNAATRTVSVWQVVKNQRDAQNIADGLIQGREQIITFQNSAEMRDEQSSILWFLLGVVYSIDGHYKEISDNVYLFTPADCDVEVRTKLPLKQYRK